MGTETEKTLGQLMEEALLTIEKKLAELDFNLGYPDDRIKYRDEQERILKIMEQYKRESKCECKPYNPWSTTRAYPSLMDALHTYTSGDTQ